MFLRLRDKLTGFPNCMIISIYICLKFFIFLFFIYFACNKLKYISIFPELFQSLLYEAVGRTVNPVNGAMGLLSTGNWHLCEAGVQTVFNGGLPAPLGDENFIPEVDESSEVFQGAGAVMMIGTQTDASNSNTVSSADVMIADDNQRNLPKLLNLFQ